ncbi:MAG: hypothetical protein H6616_04970 [Ignavibacteria bacterium]|nr:hypothetical protein [Ignavibacteria bacterium]
MPIRLIPYDIGCEPSPSVPAEVVVQDGWSTFVLFFAVSKTISETGFLKDLGVAVVECKGCSMSKFGYPNDEGRPEHPFYEFGMQEELSNILEVVGSPWAKEVQLQQKISIERIWGARSTVWEASDNRYQKHFILLFKEQTFECIADDIVVRLFAKSFSEAFTYVHKRLDEH